MITDSNVADNGRVALVNGQPDTSQTYNLPETGLTYYRVDRLFDSQGNQLDIAAGTTGAYPTVTSDANNPLAIGTYNDDISRYDTDS